MSPISVLHTRHIDAEKSAALRYFYGPRWTTSLYLATLLPIILCLLLGSPLFGIKPSFIFGLTITALLSALRQYRIHQTIRRAKYIYQYGDPQTMVITGLTETRANHRTQKIITINIAGQERDIKTFDSRVIEVYTIPQQTVYTHPEFPGFLVPSGLFDLLPE